MTSNQENRTLSREMLPDRMSRTLVLEPDWKVPVIVDDVIRY